MFEAVFEIIFVYLQQHGAEHSMYLLCHLYVYLICLCNNIICFRCSIQFIAVSTVIHIHGDVLSVRFIQFLTQ